MKNDEKNRPKKNLQPEDLLRNTVNKLVETVERINAGIPWCPEDTEKEEMGPPYGETYFEYAVLLACTRVDGKKSPEKLAKILRDPEYRNELLEKDWQLLADFIEGKLNRKRGRPKLNKSFGDTNHKLSAEYHAASLIKLQMQLQRATLKKTRGILPILIDEISAERGADPAKVAEILKKARI